ncbi:MAG: hypothetical protein JNK16_14420 [Phycisphaerales bacterium]|nr:hypothetical protein [Phycisphaerales bacterium]
MATSPAATTSAFIESGAALGAPLPDGLDAGSVMPITLKANAIDTTLYSK